MLSAGHLLILSGVVIGTGMADIWKCADFPAPQKDYVQCGMSVASWVCDPEHQLTVGDVFKINRLGIAINTMKSCLCEDCGANTDFPNTYLKVAVAIMSDFELTFGSSDHVQVELAKFAECLRTTRWRHSGDCDDDVVVVMATNVTGGNRTLISYSLGDGAKEEGLTDSCVDVIIRSNQDDVIDQRFGDALYNIVEGMKNSLAGHHYCLTSTTPWGGIYPRSSTQGTLGDSAPTVSTRTWIIVGSSIAGFFLVTCCCCCCCFIVRSRDVKDGPHVLI